MGKLDKFYMRLAKDVSRLSTCKKKQLGCILRLSNGMVIRGTNGPPQKLSECNPCPRLDSHNATNLHLCRAVHAERSVLLYAAKKGLSTNHSVLYSYMGVPCKDCIVELISAGVIKIVCIKETYYDELSKEILKEWISKGGVFKIIDT